MHELAHRPVLALDEERAPLLVSPVVQRLAGTTGREEHRVGVGIGGGVGHHLLDVDGGVPRQIGLAVPLGVLRLLVELVEGRTLALLVVPGEQGVGVVLDGVHHLVRVLGGDGQDRLEVVDVGPTEHLFVGGHGVPLVDGSVGTDGAANALTRRAMRSSHG